MARSRFPSLCLLVFATMGLLLGVARAAPVWAPQDFASVAARVVPTTVSIVTERTELRSAGLEELEASLGEGWRARGEAVATGTGSGVIVRADGIVLTNQHVVAGALSVTVGLSDRRSFPAKVLGADPRTDVAVLKILNDGPFPFAAIGDSEALRVGDPVMTVGHPYDFAFTVTAGIVSAQDRRNVSADEIQDYIQTDAAVNPGASGGPLFDRRGAVVGITTAIYASSRREGPPPTGLSFAIPSALAWRVAEDLLEGRRPARAWLGVRVEALDEPASALQPGVRVVSVLAGSPAEAAGIRAGDTLLALDEEVALDAAELGSLVRSRAVGDAISVRVLREGATLTLSARLVDVEAGGPARDGPSSAGWAGMELRAVEPSQGAPAGLLVERVEAGSPAARAGVLRGDRLNVAAGQPVTDLEALRRVVDARRVITVGLWRRDGAVSAVLVGL